MTETGIEWTDFTDNPLKFRQKADGKIVWACQKISNGCKHCYAEALARRYGRGGPFDAATMAGVEPYLDEESLRKLLTSKKISGKRVFIGDMTDIFGEWVSDEILDRLFAVFALRSDVTFQILTKRAARMRAYFDDMDDRAQLVANALGSMLDVGCLYEKVVGARRRELEHRIADLYGENSEACTLIEDGEEVEDPDYQARDIWPLRNVWLGVSVEDQQNADERIQHLRCVPAAVRFLSIEPLLGPVDIFTVAQIGREINESDTRYQSRKLGAWIDWVIVGGESGLRIMRPEWARSIRDQCLTTGVPFFFKQWGSLEQKYHTGRLLDGREWNEFPEVQA